MEIPDQTETRLRRLYGPSYVGAVQQTLKMMKEFHPDIEQFYNVEGVVQSPTRSNHPSGSCQCGTPATRQQQDKRASLKQMYGQSYMDAVQQSIELMARFHPDIEGLYNVKKAVPPPTKGARVSPTPKIDKRNAPNESCQCNTTQSSNNQGNEVFGNGVSEMLNSVQAASEPKQAIRQEQWMQERKGKWSPKADVQNKETVSIPYNSANVPPLDCEDVCLIIGNLYGTTSKRYNDCLADCEEQSLHIPSWKDAPPWEDTPIKCPPYIQPVVLPDFDTVDCVTRACFALEYGVWDWPATDCCPPPLNATSMCELPSDLELFWLSAVIPVHILSPGDGEDPNKVTPVTPTTDDQLLLAAGLAVILENSDIVYWASCLLQSWSRDIKGLDLTRRLASYLSLVTPWNVTYVATTDINATMWAFTPRSRNPLSGGNQNVNGGIDGLIVPIRATSNVDTFWTLLIEKWKYGGNEAFCAAVEVAATMLHEFIHICGDDYDSEIADAHDAFDQYAQTGTLHEVKEDSTSYEYPCWDEARMVETIFVWAMSQRYTCLTSNSCCSNMADPIYVAYSGKAMEQIWSNSRC